MVCDLMELYQFLIDYSRIEHQREIGKNQLLTKNESMTRKKVGKREYLNDLDSKKLMHSLNWLFESLVELPRIRHGKKQTVETLINEKSLLFAKYLRNEKKEWLPRIGSYKILLGD